MNNQFSENLKKIRKENNLSQEQLADELGVSRQAISKWESSVAYPEMDKIIALCEKFNVNIDDLLHKDIKEVKGEEESKKKVNSYIDEFLKYVTDTVNLFSKMTFKSKIKCLFEQALIGVALFLVSLIIIALISGLFSNLLFFLPDKIYYVINNIIESILIVFCFLSAVIIMMHIFKIRYLNYFNDVKDEASKEKPKEEEQEEIKEQKNNEKISFTKKENKIVIRDPKHSEYGFFNAVFKFIIGIIKFFLILIAIPVCCTLIGFCTSLAATFLIYKTGALFLGLLSINLSSIIIIIIILLLILNFVFNRKNDKKKMIWSFIIAVVLFGIGIGLSFIGSLDFEVTDNNESMLETRTTEIDMKDNRFIHSYSANNIEYVEENINNVKIEYTINKYCELKQFEGEKEGIYLSAECNNIPKIGKEIIKKLNDKKLVPVDDSIETIKIHASKKNIEKLKNNEKKYYGEQKEG